MKKICKNCYSSFEGRLNKEFCSMPCKSSYNNSLAKERNKNLTETVKCIKENIKILENLYSLFGSIPLNAEIFENSGFKLGYTIGQPLTNHFVYIDWAIRPLSSNTFQIIKL